MQHNFRNIETRHETIKETINNSKILIKLAQLNSKNIFMIKNSNNSEDKDNIFIKNNVSK